jgi:hypothetical protein
VEALGAGGLGFFLGYVTMFFVSRFAEFTVPSLAALLGVVLGGVVTSALGELVPEGQLAPLWAYFIGLAIGLIVWVVARLISRQPPAE